MQITSNYTLPKNRNYGNCFEYRQNNINNNAYSTKQEKYCDEFVSSTGVSKTNNISFTSSSKELQLKKEAKETFDKSIVFGPEEYKNLSKDELNTLRKYGKIFKSEDKKCINFMLKFGEKFSKQIHKKYPDGFTFVSVGRSPAFLGKTLEFQGEDVKYCPISGLSWYIGEFSPYFVQSYKKYLDSINLTKDSVKNSQKPVIITDYTCSGSGLTNFRRLLSMPEIGIHVGEKVKYSPITLNSHFKKENCIFDYDPYKRVSKNPFRFSDKTYINIMEDMSHKSYSPIPRICADLFESGCHAEEILNKYYQNGNKFEENFDTKMMNFLIADNVRNQKN